MKTLSIYAEALSVNREFKNAKIDGQTVGVANAKTWRNAVKALLIPAYRIAAYRHDHMGDSTEVAPIDMGDFYAKLREVLALVGEVNGAKLFAENIAEGIISASKRWRVIDITPEMADARSNYRIAKKAMEDPASVKGITAIDDDKKAFLEKLTAVLDDEEALATFVDDCKAEVERLEGIAGNCKKLFENQGENPFVKEVEMLLGDAINGQLAKSVETILAEMEAKRQARRAKTAAKKASKKNA